MKIISFLPILFLFVACERFPSNPPKNHPKAQTVFIEHIGTEYVPTVPPTDGLVATKVNVLFFKIKAENFRAKKLEFYGRAEIDGPPGCREHAVHFCTDNVMLIPKETGYTFNTIEEIVPGFFYTMTRSKFPTNEYSPFQGTQGMVKEITITEVWAYDENGDRFSLSLNGSD